METAWVIEDGESHTDAPLYATLRPGMSWSYNHDDALRFARQVDARLYAERHLPQKPLAKPHRIAQHQWGI